MGEVRVKVKIASALDEMLARRDQLAPDKLRAMDVMALVDTGAVRLVLPALVVEQLGLAQPHQEVAQYADGRFETVGVTEPVSIEIMGRHTNDEALVLGDEVLIGQTILGKLDLFVDARGQRLMPNPAHPDQSVSKVKRVNRAIRKA